MLVVARPQQEGSEASGLVWQLRCQQCRRCFRSLEEAWLCYQAPPVGTRAETRWVHRKCVEAGGKVKLVRGDFALRRLLESLLNPPIPWAALKDLRPRRPWGDP